MKRQMENERNKWDCDPWRMAKSVMKVCLMFWKIEGRVFIGDK